MSQVTISKVRNYQGTNSFVNKMKSVVNQYGSLTIKQVEAVEKCLKSSTVVVSKELPEDVKRIVDYTGENSFVKEIGSKFKQYGTLSEKQVSAAINQIQKEEDKERTIRMNWPVIGDSIKITRKVGEELKKTYGLQFNPIILDITKLMAVSPKAVQFEGKMTIKRGKVCTCCGRTLTDEFSMLTGIGKLCAKHIRVDYITDRSQAERFRNEYLERVEEIGKMVFWIPKSQIVKWEGITESMVKSM
jgi:uncharacterized protein (DUF433 family)